MKKRIMRNKVFVGFEPPQSNRLFRILNTGGRFSTEGIGTGFEDLKIFLMFNIYFYKPVSIPPKESGQNRDEKRNLRFPCIQWKREQNFVYVPTVYKGNANFVFRPWVRNVKKSVLGQKCQSRLYFKISINVYWYVRTVHFTRQGLGNLIGIFVRILFQKFLLFCEILI